MKITIKIIILILSVALAIGAVMIYAKTRVEPPIAVQMTNQFDTALNDILGKIENANAPNEADSLYLKAIDLISVFARENMFTEDEDYNKKKELLELYSPIFIKNSFDSFNNEEWKEVELNKLLYLSKKIKSEWQSINQIAKVENNEIADLTTIENIVSNYYQAKKISLSTQYSGLSNAENSINLAMRYANDQYLSNCKSLRIALNNVKSNIAKSHYNYISSQVEKLRSYRSYYQSYYEDTLVPQVDAAVTEYAENAVNLYGYKNDVDALWNRAREYYNEASNYYNNNY